MDGNFIEYWHWYESIDIEIEASKLPQLASYDFVEKITWGDVTWEIEPIEGVEATVDWEIDRIIQYINAKYYHDQGFYGSGVTVGIIDTGINESHPEFTEYGDIIKGKYDATPLPGFPDDYKDYKLV